MSLQSSDLIHQNLMKTSSLAKAIVIRGEFQITLQKFAALQHYSLSRRWPKKWRKQKLIFKDNYETLWWKYSTAGKCGWDDT